MTCVAIRNVSHSRCDQETLFAAVKYPRLLERKTSMTVAKSAIADMTRCRVRDDDNMRSKFEAFTYRSLETAEGDSERGRRSKYD